MPKEVGKSSPLVPKWPVFLARPSFPQFLTVTRFSMVWIVQSTFAGILNDFLRPGQDVAPPPRSGLSKEVPL